VSVAGPNKDKHLNHNILPPSYNIGYVTSLNWHPTLQDDPDVIEITASTTSLHEGDIIVIYGYNCWMTCYVGMAFYNYYTLDWLEYPNDNPNGIFTSYLTIRELKYLPVTY
jgi:hypothetical protein